MPRIFESGLKAKYPDLHKREFGLVRLLFYINALLLLAALVVLVFDLFDQFKTNYAPQAISFLGIFVLVYVFLREGKKNVALNVFLLLPVPAYFLLVSPEHAIFPPETSFQYDIYLYSTGWLILLLLSEKPLQVFTYLLVTLISLAGHVALTGPRELIFRFNWSSQGAIHPVFVYLLVGAAGAFLYLLHRSRTEEKSHRVNSLVEYQSRLFHQHFEGVLKVSVERDEFGERTDYKVVSVNPAFEENFEVRNSELKDMPVHLLFQKLFRGEVDWLTLVDTAKRTKKEILVPHTGKWFRVSSIPVDKDNIVCFFENISAAKAALTELRNSKHRYKLLLETIPDIFFVIDKDGTYIDYVPKSDNGIDLLAGEIIGSTIFEVGFSQRMVKQVSKSIKAVIAHNSIETIEYVLDVKEKGACFFEMRMVKLNNQAVMAISRDISKQKFAIQAIEEARKKAEEADMLKAAFLQNISHEVRTPLNSIVGFSNLLLTDDVSRQERVSYLQIIARNCQILLRAFSDTIKLSKIQSGIESVSNQFVNLNSLVTELDKQFIYEKGQLEKDHLRLTPMKGHDYPKFAIFSDGAKIKDIMESLIDNAIKFTEEGEIEFGYRLLGSSKVEFFVRDTGIGIPSDQFEKIFDRFYQIDQTMKRVYGGTGIGLSLANEFAEMLGSKIKVESTVGEGSRFSFVLPVEMANSHLRIV